MASTINELLVINSPATAEETKGSEGLRLARYCALEELLSLVFGVMTVGWIVLSLARLAL